MRIKIVIAVTFIACLKISIAGPGSSKPFHENLTKSRIGSIKAMLCDSPLPTDVIEVVISYLGVFDLWQPTDDKKLITLEQEPIVQINGVHDTLMFSSRPSSCNIATYLYHVTQKMRELFLHAGPPPLLIGNDLVVDGSTIRNVKTERVRPLVASSLWTFVKKDSSQAHFFIYPDTLIIRAEPLNAQFKLIVAESLIPDIISKIFIIGSKVRDACLCDNKSVAMLCEEDKIFIYKEDKKTYPFEHGQKDITAIASLGNSLALLSREGTVTKVDGVSKPVQVMRNVHQMFKLLNNKIGFQLKDSLNALVLFDDENHDNDQTLAYPLARGAEKVQITSAVQLSPKRLAIGTSTGVIQIWDLVRPSCVAGKGTDPSKQTLSNTTSVHTTKAVIEEL